VATEPSCKGASLKGYVVWVRERLGEEGARRLFAEQPDRELSALFEGEVLVSKNYPMAVHNGFLAVLARHFGADAERELRTLGAYCAARDLGGIFKVFLMVFSASRGLDTFAGLYGKYQNTGTMVVTESGPKHMVIEIRDPFNSREHDSVLAGYAEQALTMTGAKNVSVPWEHPQESCVSTLRATFS